MEGDGVGADTSDCDAVGEDAMAEASAAAEASASRASVASGSEHRTTCGCVSCVKVGVDCMLRGGAVCAMGRVARAAWSAGCIGTEVIAADGAGISESPGALLRVGMERRAVFAGTRAVQCGSACATWSGASIGMAAAVPPLGGSPAAACGNPEGANEPKGGAGG